MQFRFPWILSRRRLLVAVLIDSGLFIILQSYLLISRFEIWPDGSMLCPLVWAIWVLSSYVLGRYKGVENFGTTKNEYLSLLLESIINAFFVIFIDLALISIGFLLIINIDPATLILYLISFLISLGISSSLAQTSLACWLLSKSTLPYSWNFLGDHNSFERLQYHLEWARLPARLSNLTDSELFQKNYSYIVVNCASEESTSVVQRLIELRKSNSLVVTKQQWCEMVLQRIPSEYLSDEDLLFGDYSFRTSTFQTRLKRIGDLFLSSLLLLFTSPLILISALLIKFEDGGPVLYSQIRTGFEGRPYKIWKLRSMKTDAELHGVQWVKKADDRITTIGSVLRRTRIDELPQLFCVFTGNMSLIGPRPERPEFDENLQHQIPYYRLRHRMRPGLSGWAQVNYPYGASVEDAANKLSYDLFYMRNFSFWLDLLILLKTIRLVFNAKGSQPTTKANV